MRILKALGSELNFVEVEQLVKSDPSLCYRLLRYLNSPAFYLQSEIRSILHALALLGEQEVRKWLLLVCAVEIAEFKAPELLQTALVRARFGELLAPLVGVSRSAMFLFGLMSLMDAILDVPSQTITEQIALPSEVKAALLGQPSPLHRCHDLVLAYESADWESCLALRKECQIPTAQLKHSYFGAIDWAKRITVT